MRSLRRPLHLLLLYHPLTHHFIYRGLDKTRTYPFAASVALGIVDDVALVVGDVGFHLIGILEHPGSSGSIGAREHFAVFIHVPTFQFHREIAYLFQRFGAVAMPEVVFFYALS